MTIAPELEASGWTPVDETGRYLRHEARFGPAIFDRADVVTMERGGKHALAPRRAAPCRCRYSAGDPRDARCYWCGRWAR